LKLKINVLKDKWASLRNICLRVFQDNKYLEPYIEEVARERREKEEWKKK
jgi:hypothetical protein